MTNYFEQAQEARQYIGIAEALLEKDISEKDKAKLEIFVELLDGIEKKYKTLDILPDEERRRWIAGKEAKEFGLLKEMKTKLPGKPEDLEFVVTNPEATLYVAIEVMNERYGGTTK